MIKKIFFCFFIFLIGFSLGMVFQKIAFSPQDISTAYQRGKEAGWQAAKNKLVESGFIQGLSNKIQIKSISGTVQAVDIKRNVIMIKTRPLNPLEDPDLSQRIVRVSKETNIIAYIKKPKERYQKEFTELVQSGNLQQATNSPNAGLKEYDEKKINISQIETGKMIVVYSASDLKEKKEIMATKIVVYN